MTINLYQKNKEVAPFLMHAKRASATFNAE